MPLPTLAMYLAGLVTLVLGDLLWLGVLMRPFYVAHLGHLMAPSVTWPAAVLFYLVYTAGIMVFAVTPQLEKGLLAVLAHSALFGLVCYAVYDLTNHATLKNWPLAVTVVDMLWGGLLTALVGAVAYGVHTWLGR